MNKLLFYSEAIDTSDDYGENPLQILRRIDSSVDLVNTSLEPPQYEVNDHEESPTPNEVMQEIIDPIEPPIDSGAQFVDSIDSVPSQSKPKRCSETNVIPYPIFTHVPSEMVTKNKSSIRKPNPRYALSVSATSISTLCNVSETLNSKEWFKAMR